MSAAGDALSGITSTAIQLKPDDDEAKQLLKSAGGG